MEQFNWKVTISTVSHLTIEMCKPINPKIQTQMSFKSMMFDLFIQIFHFFLQISYRIINDISRLIPFQAFISFQKLYKKNLK